MENRGANGRTLRAPVFVDSIPKAGTHLLSKTLENMPGIEHCGLHLERKTIASYVDPGVSFPLQGREDIDADRFEDLVGEQGEGLKNVSSCPLNRSQIFLE